MKRVLASLLATGVIILLLAGAGFFFFVDTAPLSKADFIRTMARFKAFRHAGLVELDEREVKTLFKWTCTGRCHGPDPVETSRHTSREWRTIIERMRANGADVTAREEEVLVSYLGKNYGSNVPTILAPGVNRFLKRHLWKSDFGESDLYVDLIYSPVEYFEVMGELLQMRRYEADRNYVFMVYLNTHQEKLKPFPLGELAVLRDGAGNEIEPLDWQVLYTSGDMHHIEGVLRFRRKGAVKQGAMEVVLRDLPGQKERVFVWDLPIPPFSEVKAEEEASGGRAPYY